jgi:hypothetical protein
MRSFWSDSACPGTKYLEYDICYFYLVNYILFINESINTLIIFNIKFYLMKFNDYSN